MKHEHVYEINQKKKYQTLSPDANQKRIHDGRTEASGCTMYVKEKTEVVNLLNAILCQETYFHCTGLNLKELHSLDERTHSKIVDKRKLSGKRRNIQTIRQIQADTRGRVV
jgi:hypothetical protein